MIDSLTFVGRTGLKAPVIGRTGLKEPVLGCRFRRCIQHRLFTAVRCDWSHRLKAPVTGRTGLKAPVLGSTLYPAPPVHGAVRSVAPA